MKCLQLVLKMKRFVQNSQNVSTWYKGNRLPGGQVKLRSARLLKHKVREGDTRHITLPSGIRSIMLYLSKELTLHY